MAPTKSGWTKYGTDQIWLDQKWLRPNMGLDQIWVGPNMGPTKYAGPNLVRPKMADQKCLDQIWLDIPCLFYISRRLSNRLFVGSQLERHRPCPAAGLFVACKIVGSTFRNALLNTYILKEEKMFLTEDIFGPRYFRLKIFWYKIF